jgi:DNA-binding MarR family transcriptional regulator
MEKTAGIPEETRRLRRIARECIAKKVRLINRAVTGLYDAALRPYDLKVSQLNVLVAVSLLGEAKPNDLIRALRMDKSTLSRNVDRLLSRRWVEDLPDDDARAYRLRITPAGRSLLRKVEEAWAGAQRRMARDLGDGDVEALDRIARKLRGRMPAE